MVEKEFMGFEVVFLCIGFNLSKLNFSMGALLEQMYEGNRISAGTKLRVDFVDTRVGPNSSKDPKEVRG